MGKLLNPKPLETVLKVQIGRLGQSYEAKSGQNRDRIE